MVNSLPSETDRIHADLRAHGDRIDADLRSCGGIVQALMHLQDSIELACKGVAIGVQGVAWAIDAERRGIQSTQERQDAGAVLRNVGGLIDSAILRDVDRADLLQRLAELVVDRRGRVPEQALREATKDRLAAKDLVSSDDALASLLLPGKSVRGRKKAKVPASSMGNGIYGDRAPMPVVSSGPGKAGSADASPSRGKRSRLQKDDGIQILRVPSYGAKTGKVGGRKSPKGLAKRSSGARRAKGAK